MSRAHVASGVVVLVALLCGAHVAAAQPVEKGTFGVGLIIGEPTGIAAKLYLDDDHAIQGAVGFAFVGGGVHVHADYLWHPWAQDRENLVLVAYVGPGLRIVQYREGREDDYFAAGARVVGGMLLDFKEIPLDVFVEIAPLLEWRFGEADDEHGIGFSINAGIGARYYF